MWILDRPDRSNALSRAVVRELARLAREAEDDASLRVVMITGAGEKVFCAGADLKERQGMSEEDVRDFLSLYRVAFGAIDRLAKPVVAVMNGSAFGGGLELALACDLRVVASHALLGLTETSLGIIPGAGGTQRLPRLVGEARAKELILLARRITAAEAQAIGLVHHVVPTGESLLEAATKYVEPLVQGAPIAIAAALEAVDAASGTPLEAGLSLERRAYERTLASKDRLEALAAFAEKRKPVFAGA